MFACIDQRTISNGIVTQAGKFFIHWLNHISQISILVNRWAVVIAERVNPMDVKAMEDAVREAVTG